MLKHFVTVIFVSLLVSLTLATPAFAQRTSGAPLLEGGPGATNPGLLTDGRNGTVVTRGIPSRMNQTLRRAAVARATPPVNAEVRAATEDLAIAAGSDCQVTESKRVGFDAQHKPIYEAACASGLGYLFVASTPPTAVDCVRLASTARLLREQDPTAEVGALCERPAKADPVAVVAKFAREAGVTCDVDDALEVGQSSGAIIYEVGCSGRDGYWVQRSGTTFGKTECLQVQNQGEPCRFTTTAEQAATLGIWLAGSQAAVCDVQQARYLGGNDDGSFYEAKCATGEGYVAQLDQQKVVQRTYPCAAAKHIGGGCTLTEDVVTTRD